jgi:hypothetical protein
MAPVVAGGGVGKARAAGHRRSMVKARNAAGRPDRPDPQGKAKACQGAVGGSRTALAAPGPAPAADLRGRQEERAAEQAAQQKAAAARNAGYL